MKDINSTLEIETDPFDPAEYVRNPEEAAIYLNDAIESGDPAVVAAAVGTIARAHGTTELAKSAGLSRAVLYSGFSKDGNPTLATLMTVLREMGLLLSVLPTRSR